MMPPAVPTIYSTTICGTPLTDATKQTKIVHSERRPTPGSRLAAEARKMHGQSDRTHQVIAAVIEEMHERIVRLENRRCRCRED